MNRQGVVKAVVMCGGIALLHFVLSVGGTVRALPAAFDTQVSVWHAPLSAAMSALSTILLAPVPIVRPILPAAWRNGYLEIATVSVLVAAVATVLLRIGRRGIRPQRATPSRVAAQMEWS